MEYRVERDSMGEMKVPADVYWGAQTQRSYENFRIGSEKMPPELIRALGMLKKQRQWPTTTWENWISDAGT